MSDSTSNSSQTALTQVFTAKDKASGKTPRTPKWKKPLASNSSKRDETPVKASKAPAKSAPSSSSSSSRKNHDCDIDQTSLMTYTPKRKKPDFDSRSYIDNYFFASTNRFDLAEAEEKNEIMESTESFCSSQESTQRSLFAPVVDETNLAVQQRKIQVRESESIVQYILSGVPARMEANRLKQALARLGKGIVFAKNRVMWATTITKPSKKARANGCRVGKRHYIHVWKGSQAQVLLEKVTNGVISGENLARTMGINKAVEICKTVGKISSSKPLVFLRHDSEEYPLSNVLKQAVVAHLEKEYDTQINPGDFVFSCDEASKLLVLRCAVPCDANAILNWNQEEKIAGVSSVIPLNEFKSRQARLENKLIKATLACKYPLRESDLVEIQNQMMESHHVTFSADSFKPFGSILSQGLILTSCYLEISKESKADDLKHGIRLSLKVKGHRKHPVLVSLSTKPNECRIRSGGSSNKSKSKNKTQQEDKAKANPIPKGNASKSVPQRNNLERSHQRGAPSQQTSGRQRTYSEVVSSPPRVPRQVSLLQPPQQPNQNGGMDEMLKMISQLNESLRRKDLQIEKLQQTIEDLTQEVRQIRRNPPSRGHPRNRGRGNGRVSSPDGHHTMCDDRGLTQL